MSKPVTRQRVGGGLAGERAAEDLPVADRPRREDEAAPRPPATPISRTRSGRVVAGASQAITAQVSPIQIASLRVSAARPMRTPRPTTRGSVSRAPRGSRAIRVISRQAASASAANGIVESGSDECEQERQVDRARQAGAERQGPGPADGQARAPRRRRRRAARRAPARAPRSRPTRPGRPRTSGRGWPSGSRPGTSAAAARPRTPVAGRRAAASGSSTARPRRARGPRAGCARRRRSRRCPRAWGRRSATRTIGARTRATMKTSPADRSSRGGS